jgi:hypothetical protein
LLIVFIFTFLFWSTVCFFNSWFLQYSCLLWIYYIGYLESNVVHFLNDSLLFSINGIFSHQSVNFSQFLGEKTALNINKCLYFFQKIINKKLCLLKVLVYWCKFIHWILRCRDFSCWDGFDIINRKQHDQADQCPIYFKTGHVQKSIQYNLDIGIPHYERFHILFSIIQVFICLSLARCFSTYRKRQSEWNKNIQKYFDFEIILYESIPISKLYCT